MNDVEDHRRRWLAGTAFTALSGGLSACAAPGPAVPAGRPAPPTDFVLVHGAWHGAWCWDQVLPLLDEAGIEATLDLHGDADSVRRFREGGDAGTVSDNGAAAAQLTRQPLATLTQEPSELLFEIAREIDT